MSKPVELKGRPASPGVAAGPLFRFDAEITRRLPSGDPRREREALDGAIALSIAQLDALIAAAEAEDGAILEFQAAMLADDELAAPAHDRIDRGDSAEAAWATAL